MSGATTRTATSPPPLWTTSPRASTSPPTPQSLCVALATPDSVASKRMSRSPARAIATPSSRLATWPRTGGRMNLRTATTLVIEDLRANKHPAFTDREALEHAGSLNEADYPEHEDETDLNKAYRMVIRVYGPNGGFAYPGRPIPPLV